MTTTMVQLRVIELYNDLDVVGRNRNALLEEAYAGSSEILRLRQVAPPIMRKNMRARMTGESQTKRQVSNFAAQAFVLIVEPDLDLEDFPRSPFVDLREFLLTPDSGS